jgi:hypothetical protein
MDKMTEYRPLEQDFSTCLLRILIVGVVIVACTIFILGFLIGIALISSF